MTFFSDLLIAVLIGQIFFASLAPVYAQEAPIPQPGIPSEPIQVNPAETSDSKAENADLEQTLGSATDFANLKGQRLKITVYEKYNSSKTSLLDADRVIKFDDIDLSKRVTPQVPFADFKTEVTVSLNPQQRSLSFIFWRQDLLGRAIKYEHEINNVDPIAYGSDGEILLFLDGKKGRGIDMGLAQDLAFRAPIPNSVVLKLEKRLRPGQVEIRPVVTGLKPWSKVDPDAVVPDGRLDKLNSGSFAVIEEKDGVRTLQGYFDRSPVHSSLFAQEVCLALLAMPFAKPGTDLYDQLAKLTQLVNDAHVQDPSGMDTLSRGAIIALGVKGMDSIIKRAQFNHLAQFRPQDITTLRLLQKRWEEIYSEAVRQDQLAREATARDAHFITLGLAEPAASQDFRVNGLDLWSKARAHNRGEVELSAIKKFFRGGLSSNAMKMFATFTKGGIVALGAYYSGSWLLHHQNELWLAKKFADVYDSVYSSPVFTALTNAEYRRHLPKTFLVSAVGVPLLYAVGSLAAQARSMDSRGFLGLMDSMKGMISVTMHSALDYVVRGGLQKPNFMEALKLNLNPWDPVDVQNIDGKIQLADKNVPAPIYSVQPGLDKVPRGISRKEIVKRNEEILELRARREVEKRAFSVLIGLLAVCPKENVDAAFVAALMKRGSIPLPALEEWANNPQLREDLIQLRYELGQAMVALSSQAINWDDVDPKIFLETYQKAQKIVAEFKERPGYEKFQDDLYRRVKSVQEGMLPAIGGFTLQDSSIVDSFWSARHQRPLGVVIKSLVTDTFMTITQKMIFGARANPGEINSIAAVMEHNRLYGTHFPLPNNNLTVGDNRFGVSAGFATETVNQEAGMIYGSIAYANAASKMQSAIAEKTYEPVEYHTLVGEPKVDSMAHAIWEIAKEGAKFWLYEGGTYELMSLKIKLSGVQWLSAVNMSVRMFFGQTLLDAGLGYGYSFWSSSVTGLGWVWDIDRNGIERYKENIRRRSQELDDARRLISQGLRFDDLFQVRAGYAQLYSFYNENLPNEFVIAKEDAEEILKKTPEELTTLQEEAAKISTFSDKWEKQIEYAITAGDTRQVESLVKQMREDFANQPESYHGSDALKREALSLLAHSLRNAPFATEPNRLAINLLNSTASFTTTYANGFILKKSLEAGMHLGGEYALLGLTLPAFYGGTMAVQSYMRKNLPPEVLAEKWGRVRDFCNLGLGARGKPGFSLPPLPKSEAKAKVRQNG